MGWRTVVVNKNCKLSYKNDYLIVRSEELKMIHLSEVNMIIIEVLKLFGVKIDKSCYLTILEKLECLIDIMATLKIAKILIIPNLKQYLSEEEIVEFYKYSMYNNIKLLIIERINNKKLKYENILRIDNEFDDIFV